MRFTRPTLARGYDTDDERPITRGPNAYRRRVDRRPARATPPPLPPPAGQDQGARTSTGHNEESSDAQGTQQDGAYSSGPAGGDWGDNVIYPRVRVGSGSHNTLSYQLVCKKWGWYTYRGVVGQRALTPYRSGLSYTY